jgi:hypothetical protein
MFLDLQSFGKVTAVLLMFDDEGKYVCCYFFG